MSGAVLFPAPNTGENIAQSLYQSLDWHRFQPITLPVSEDSFCKASLSLSSRLTEVVSISFLTLASCEAAHDTGSAKEPQETDKANDGEGAGCEQQEFEEPGSTRRSRRPNAK